MKFHISKEWMQKKAVEEAGLSVEVGVTNTCFSCKHWRMPVFPHSKYEAMMGWCGLVKDRIDWRHDTSSCERHEPISSTTPPPPSPP